MSVDDATTAIWRFLTQPANLSRLEESADPSGWKRTFDHWIQIEAANGRTYMATSDSVLASLQARHIVEPATVTHGLVVKPKIRSRLMPASQVPPPATVAPAPAPAPAPATSAPATSAPATSAPRAPPGLMDPPELHTPAPLGAPTHFGLQGLPSTGMPPPVLPFGPAGYYPYGFPAMSGGLMPAGIGAGITPGGVAPPFSGFAVPGYPTGVHPVYGQVMGPSFGVPPYGTPMTAAPFLSPPIAGGDPAGALSSLGLPTSAAVTPTSQSLLPPSTSAAFSTPMSTVTPVSTSPAPFLTGQSTSNGAFSMSSLMSAPDLISGSTGSAPPPLLFPSSSSASASTSTSASTYTSTDTSTSTSASIPILPTTTTTTPAAAEPSSKFVGSLFSGDEDPSASAPVDYPPLMSAPPTSAPAPASAPAAAATTTTRTVWGTLAAPTAAVTAPIPAANPCFLDSDELTFDDPTTTTTSSSSSSSLSAARTTPGRTSVSETTAAFWEYVSHPDRRELLQQCEDRSIFDATVDEWKDEQAALGWSRGGSRAHILLTLRQAGLLHQIPAGYKSVGAIVKDAVWAKLQAGEAVPFALPSSSSSSSSSSTANKTDDGGEAGDAGEGDGSYEPGDSPASVAGRAGWRATKQACVERAATALWKQFTADADGLALLKRCEDRSVFERVLDEWKAEDPGVRRGGAAKVLFELRRRRLLVGAGASAGGQRKQGELGAYVAPEMWKALRTAIAEGRTGADVAPAAGPPPRALVSEMIELTHDFKAKPEEKHHEKHRTATAFYDYITHPRNHALLRRCERRSVYDDVFDGWKRREELNGELYMGSRGETLFILRSRNLLDFVPSGGKPVGLILKPEVWRELQVIADLARDGGVMDDAEEDDGWTTVGAKYGGGGGGGAGAGAGAGAGELSPSRPRAKNSSGLSATALEWVSKAPVPTSAGDKTEAPETATAFWDWVTAPQNLAALERGQERVFFDKLFGDWKAREASRGVRRVGSSGSTIQFLRNRHLLRSLKNVSGKGAIVDPLVLARLHHH